MKIQVYIETATANLKGYGHYETVNYRLIFNTIGDELIIIVIDVDTERGKF